MPDRDVSWLPAAHAGAYLHQPPLVHGAQDEEGVGRPLDVLDLVQARVQAKDLQAVHVADHQPVLHAGSLEREKLALSPCLRGGGRPRARARLSSLTLAPRSLLSHRTL